MELWLLTRNDNVDYDQYDSFVVLAETEFEARQLATKEETREYPWGEVEIRYDWSDIIKVECKQISLRTSSAQVLLGSFNAG